MKELRSLLAASIAFQARFAALRLERALPKMLEAVPIGDRKRIQENFDRAAGEPQGLNTRFRLNQLTQRVDQALLLGRRHSHTPWRTPAQLGPAWRVS